MTGYNGWTNYETWRIGTEYFDDCEYMAAKELKASMENTVKETSTEGSLARYLAEDFIAKVDWDEIEEYLAEKWEIE